jgi:hypothetical protein
MSNSERESGIKSTLSMVEDIATTQADIKFNDLSRQFDTNIDDDRLAVTGIGTEVNSYEFEPFLMQVDSVAYIPSEVYLDDKSRGGILIDNIVYFVSANVLYLWDEKTRSLDVT